MPRLSELARNLTSETAFTVLAAARALKATGKDVVELEIDGLGRLTNRVVRDAG